MALTGGIASGKSFVADEFAALGAVIVDSDLIAREVVEPGTPGLAQVVQRFGEGVLAEDGSLDRARLGAIVFSEDAARADLNAIVHPLVRRRAADLERAAPEGSVVIQVIPLLVETGLDEGFDTVLVVDVPVEAQIERLMRRNALTEADALARINAQADRGRRLAAATHVIENSGSRSATRERVREVWRDLSVSA
ncbi:dephospho-CoA kinase [Tessaracoccus aquimaris]|uniref:Dephospho-CoA kinase n=1 Tax=Tessaracoccus aquimaris TaxID=1332264 RepID=A0A1Q2CT05_9ACTN|nr:dephospho-CoA kinase [Tessaracoccus aquimaris]